MLTSSSLAMMPASVVLPRPGGPASSTWSSVSPRLRAACTKISSCSLAPLWPTKSSKRLRAQRLVEVALVGELAGVGDAVGGRRHMPPFPREGEPHEFVERGVGGRAARAPLRPRAG